MICIRMITHFSEQYSLSVSSLNVQCRSKNSHKSIYNHKYPTNIHNCMANAYCSNKLKCLQTKGTGTLWFYAIAAQHTVVQDSSGRCNQFNTSLHCCHRTFINIFTALQHYISTINFAIIDKTAMIQCAILTCLYFHYTKINKNTFKTRTAALHVRHRNCLHCLIYSKY